MFVIVKKEDFDGKTGEGGTAKGKPQARTNARIVWTWVARLLIRLGATKSNASLVCCILRRARVFNLHMYWSMLGLYSLLALDSYKGQASKWAYTGKSRWSESLGKFFPGIHFVASKHGNVADGEPESNRMLPEPCVGSCAFLFLLCRWALVSVQCGGFKKRANIEAARDLLDCVLATACKRQKGSSFPITLDPEWKLIWPRPHRLYGDQCIQATLLPCGSIELRQLYRLDLTASSRFVQKLHELCFGSEQQEEFDGIVPIPRVLATLLSTAGFEAIGAQITAALSSQLESALAVHDLPETSVCRFSFRDKTIHVNDLDLNEKLFGYVESGKLEAQKHTVFCMAADKSAAGVFNATLTFPNNVAILCCPNVLLHSI